MEHNYSPVFWFTGLSGAGKTTTAEALLQRLKSEGKRAELLDGDVLRAVISKGLGFSREDRMENIRRIVYISKLLSRNGVIVLVSAITPYQAMRDYARSELPGYTEIYVDCPLEECERRDVKGLYAKARSAQLANFTGVGDPYEVPQCPDLVLRTDRTTLEENMQRIRKLISSSGLEWRGPV
ncbi:adenylyl-sulfate kinase [Paenibacillus thailandensis]|jgi:adenylylsulfate kinase|uniref:Adenylyl-sulfate kinase n=1 Tax=Paenibacillus thailandensis TaxID=393250 RepID=A0ABW5QSK2_9BACL